MRKSTLKAAAVAVAAGTLFQLAGGGCLNAIVQQALVQVVADQVRPFVPNFTDFVGGGTAGG